MLKIITTFICLSVSLFAEIEYDIIVLAPEGQELVDTDIWDISECLNEAGYAWNPENSFVYHQNFGFKKVPLQDKNQEAKVISVNNHGIAVGIINERIYYYDNYYNTNLKSIFVYNTIEDEFYDLLERFGSNEMDGYSLNNCEVSNLTISDNNKIIFKKRQSYYTDDHRTFIYDLNAKTISISNYGFFYKANQNGQMIGGDADYDYQGTEAWFYDLNTYHSLGSLDKFNRWPVKPEVLSQNGYVAGTGLNSYAEETTFIWNKDLGLKEISPPGEFFYFHAINDHGQAVATVEIENKYDFYTRSFIVTPELGFVDLGDPAKESYVYDINNHGQVIGRSEPRSGKDRAFIWDQEQGIRDLTTLIPANTGWKDLTEAISINDSGLIVGTGNYYGVEQFFLLIPKK